jgi:preprotein translocase subunit YajC
MLLLAVLFVIMYLMLIRPENKRKKKIENMRNALRKGDTVYTIGGVIGKVVAIDEEKLTIETSEDRVRIEFAKWAIQNVEAVANKTESSSEDNSPAKKYRLGKKKAEEETVVVPEEPVAEAAAEETTEEK